MPSEFSYTCVIFHNTPYGPEQVMWSHTVAAAVNRSFPVSIPPFLSFITERVWFVPEFEYLSALFIIVACVWKELVLSLERIYECTE